MAKNNITYPVVDLFAGPGGLGEGFSALKNRNGSPAFNSVASFERDPHAYRTLLLRHFFRSFDYENIPYDYYDYVSGDITFDYLVQKYPTQFQSAKASAFPISLEQNNHAKVRNIIKRKVGKGNKWVLIGGPPCQAYSTVGRSRLMGNPDFEKDERHFLYREYLKIIVDHKPPVFVMENVKGLLSAKVRGKSVVAKIVNDLSHPTQAARGRKNGLSYRLYSLSSHDRLSGEIDPATFIVKAEDHGIPQARHRMFIVGIRSDIDIVPSILSKSKAPNVRSIIGNLPKLRSGISKQKDSVERWRKIFVSSRKAEWYREIRSNGHATVAKGIRNYISSINSSPVSTHSDKYLQPNAMRKWYGDSRISKLTLHDARYHMESDLHRYLYAATYAEIFGVSPILKYFPSALLPEHKNVPESLSWRMFPDRFRVQVPDRVSTTITSHISKDGHYFIHYDPAQCRSLTVREAARLQTFPDNYHFEGHRTQQYHQVGNAVPPYLAIQIAEIIKEVLDGIPEK